MNIVTYEQRVSRMKVPGDEDIQLYRAKAYVKRLKRESRSAPSLADKLEYQEAIKEAEGVLRKLRVNIFALNDELIASTRGVV